MTSQQYISTFLCLLLPSGYVLLLSLSPAELSSPCQRFFEIIRILHVCEVLIENYVPMVTVWHHKALPSDAKQ